MQPETALARLVPYADGRFVALPVHTALEVAEHPQPVAVPGAPRHALGLLAWQGKRIPMIDLGVLLGQAPARSRRYALVVAWQDGDGAAIEHGAIALDALPQTVSVANDSACSLPEGGIWPQVALSCFVHGEQPVPVVHTAALFA